MAKSKSSTKTAALRGSTRVRRAPKRKRSAFGPNASTRLFSPAVEQWQTSAANAAERVANAAAVLAMLARTTARQYENDKTPQGDKALQDWQLVEYMAETIHGHYAETINAVRGAQKMLEVLTNGGWSKGGAR